MRILIAEDDSTSRLILKRSLEKWGHEVIATKDGAEAWEILQKEPIRFVITDWMMPELDGVELSKRIRAAHFSHYIYIILLTAKIEKTEIVDGLEAGADDFVTKPFNKHELKVRIKAGERIIRLEKDLEERNESLQEAYTQIRKDLEAASNMQQNLLPSASSTMPGISFDWLFLPCTVIAGDIFNFFQLSENNIGFYLLDVSGHGIPAAMLSVTISKVLSPTFMNGNEEKHSLHGKSHHDFNSPASVIQELNQRFQGENNSMQYFTMVYGTIDTKNKELKLCQAGHPSPIYVKNGAYISHIGNGGMPVGMLPEIEYEEQSFDFTAGDRLFLFSDGVTECENADKEQFSSNRLVQLLEGSRSDSLAVLMQKVKGQLQRWNGSEQFEDDVTLLAIEME
ncbi:MAG: PP2C family protein-serine/threonine phosphatase [bacterium]